MFIRMRFIEENIQNVKENIAKAAEKAGKNPEEIALVAVSKTVEPERIREALRCGIKIIGENRVQEAEDKFKQIPEEFKKHLVGHLQTNKAKKAVELFDMIQSLDSIRLAEEISKRAKAKGKTMDVLVEVNTSSESTKYGLEPDEVIGFMKQISNLEGVKTKGLMTIGLFSSDMDLVRPCFKKLKSIFDEFKEKDIANIEMEYLSMGMTQDYEVAIEEGANMVRIGTAIFGRRD
jgi:pyridoxal phosphate enzyme (YggS family)